MRRALALAIEQGEGETPPSCTTTLRSSRWLYEGPQAGLAVYREGIDFSERRGITESASNRRRASCRPSPRLGQAEQALTEAAPLAERIEAAGDVVFIEPRSLQLRLLAERGDHQRAP